MGNLNKIQKLAKEAGKSCEYNESTGEYQITDGFTRSIGVYPFFDENYEDEINDQDFKILLECI